ncbi:hypothetical protein DFP72DRAFT_1022411 [Ephemerocybe angulata]|uniref:Uncharacterized protein n=1 Tax=Ephemerocybe angulata TaxID=980116 RepID=A0A8H6HAA5_9AGAR|nr:hypothetical protein DFP72DRAFT_1022411 [Tulosesus angulatus]
MHSPFSSESRPSRSGSPATAFFNPPASSSPGLASTPTTSQSTLRTPLLDQPAEGAKDCPGGTVNWTLGSVLYTYPFHLHAFRAVGWEPLRFNRDENTITFRSENCDREASSNGGACDACLVLLSSDPLRRVMERAENAPKHTPHEFLNAAQMKKLLGDFGHTMRRLRTQVYNLKQQVAGAHRKLDDYGRIMMLLSKGDIPGLRRLLAASLKRGASPAVVLNLLERSLKGLHKARGGFSDRDMDIAFLTKAIGGPRLLYALQQAFGVASRSTLSRGRKIPILVPSIGRPTADEVNANISAFCDPAVNPPHPTKKGALVGNTLMFDGVTLETRCTYCPKRNRVLGLCREHSHRVDTEVKDMASIEAIRKAIFEPDTDGEKVCFGTEATVVAIAAYHPEQYSAIPLVASPSCKTETGAEIRVWIKSVTEWWKEHEFGERVHGPIWALGSDGDSAYRYAKYLECLEDSVSVNTEEGYGKVLAELEGLNLLTSPDGILGTCDPKHIFKRFATLLRNTSGFMVEETNINASDVLKHLTELDGMTREVAEELLNPADKQNVPKAVSLLQHLKRMEESTGIGPLTPAEEHRGNTVKFLGQFFHLFLRPFIDTKMDLSEQVESLSAFAHIAAALYLRHQTGCLTGALYADTQAVIKNIIFTIARMQEIDEDLVLHIILEGTDRLELLFGDTRTQDHSSNFDIKQFAEKAAVGTQINAAFARNPDLDRGHQRLSIHGTIGIDHVNPRSWEGNVRVGDVDLKRCWDNGRKLAIQLMKKYLPTFEIPDFSAIWRKANHDLLRPKGVYVGTRRTDDDARSEDEADDLDDLAHLDLDEESDSLNRIQEATVCGDLDNKSPSDMDDEDSVNSAEMMSILSATLLVNGKHVFKSSVVASMLSSKWSKKFGDRMLRVRGMAKGEFSNSKIDDLDDSQLTENQVKSGDLAGVLLNASPKNGSSKTIALSVIEVTGFLVQGERAPRRFLEFDELDSTKTKVIGQVIDLELSGVGAGWDWSGHYLRVGSKTTNDADTRKQYVLEVPGSLVYPLCPKIVKRGSQTSGSLSLTTWRLENDVLQKASSAAWAALNPETEEIVGNIDMLPRIDNSRFPYRDSADKQKFVIEAMPAQLNEIAPPKRINSRVECFLCGEEGIQLREMVRHVGCHILHASRGASAPSSLEPGATPCGFCGRDGECLTQLKKSTAKGLTVSSTCPYRRSNMPPNKRYNDFDPESPCTNTPVHCTLCPKTASNDPRTIWRYNAAYHIASEHQGVPVPPDLLITMFISRKEEAALGIAGEDTDDFRGMVGMPDSDAMDAMWVGSDDSPIGRGRSSTIMGPPRR